MVYDIIPTQPGVIASLIYTLNNHVGNSASLGDLFGIRSGAFTGNPNSKGEFIRDLHPLAGGPAPCLGAPDGFNSRVLGATPQRYPA